MNFSDDVEAFKRLDEGLYLGIPPEVYHAAPVASKSALAAMRPPKTPAHARDYRDHDIEASDSMKLGSAEHAALFEPERFGDRFAKREQCAAIKKGDGLRCEAMGSTPRFKGGKIVWYCGTKGHDPGDALAAANVIGLVPEHYAAVSTMRDNLLAHPLASNFVRADGYTEVSFIYRHPVGILIKGRIDKLMKHQRTIGDLKTGQDGGVEEPGFHKQFGQHNLHWQAKLYLDAAQALGLDVDTFVWAVVENFRPYLVSYFEVKEGDEALEVAKIELEPILALWLRCEQTDTWPGYPPVAVTPRIFTPRVVKAFEGAI